MTHGAWIVFRRIRGIFFTSLAILSVALACLFILYASRDFSGSTVEQRGVIVLLPVLYSVAAIFLYLLVVVVFRQWWEFVRVGFLLVLYGMSSALFTIPSTHLPCHFGAAAVCKGVNTMALVGVWFMTGSVVMYALALAVMTSCAGPCEPFPGQSESDDLPTPSIRGLRRDSATSMGSVGQLASVKGGRPAFRLSRPPSLRKEQAAWPPTIPATPDTTRNLSPRARDHYARMGMPNSATRSGSFDTSSEKGLLPDNASYMSHAHTASSGSATSSHEFARPRIGLPPAVSPAPSVYLPLVRPIQPPSSRGITSVEVPVSSRASSVYSVYTTADTTSYNGGGNTYPFVFAPSSAAPSMPPFNSRQEDRRPSSSTSRSRPSTPRVSPGHSPAGSVVGLPPRPSTSGRPVEPAGVRIGLVQATRAQTNGPGRSFHSVSPSLHPKSSHESSSMPTPPQLHSLTPGDVSQRAVRFME